MDTSKTYIKMSNHPKIQGEWKLKEGDWFSFIGDIHILADYEIDALNKRETDVECYNEVVKLMGGHFVDHWNECRDGFVWLPRQDQIQKMIGNFATCVDILTNMEDYPDFFETYIGFPPTRFIQFCELPKFGSMEKLWLCIYMYGKHKLTWDGEKWTKEKQ